MGFDPRQWASSPQRRSHERVTSNVAALLAENDSLRREVQQLRRQLERLRAQPDQRRWTSSSRQPAEQPSTDHTPKVTKAQVNSWGELLSQQKNWTSLRLQGLDDLIDRLNRQSFHPELNLQQRLDRLSAGLGADLFVAVANARSKKRSAVLAAFTLYGVRASEWLEEEPRRVVADLLQRMRQGQTDGQSHGRTNRRTRSDRRTTDREDGQQHTTNPTRLAALEVLGLLGHASSEEIKQAHRRLVKLHHPDMGGSAEAFRRVNEAYQYLVS